MFTLVHSIPSVNPYIHITLSPQTIHQTQVECARGSLNQVPPHATFSGDIRLTPFYDMADVKAKVEG